MIYSIDGRRRRRRWLLLDSVTIRISAERLRLRRDVGASEGVPRQAFRTEIINAGWLPLRTGESGAFWGVRQYNEL